MGADLRLGGLVDGIAMIFFPLTFIVHNQKSKGGGGGGMAPRSPIVTPLSENH